MKPFTQADLTETENAAFLLDLCDGATTYLWISRAASEVRCRVSVVCVCVCRCRVKCLREVRRGTTFASVCVCVCVALAIVCVGVGVVFVCSCV